MREIPVQKVTAAVKAALLEMNYDTGPDVAAAVRRAWEGETSPLSRGVLEDILANHRIAAERRMAICQDTGMVILFAELGQELSQRGEHFSPIANESLAICEGAVEEVLGLTIRALTQNDLDAALRVEPLEDTIDILTERLKAQHVARLQSGQCTLSRGFVFNDCVNNFERVADHCSNIAVAIIELESDSFDTHEYLNSVRAMKSSSFARYYEEYKQEYHL